MRLLALCVGINDYPTAPLQGCVNDARDWQHALQLRGYEVHTLHDREATAGTILGVLAALAGRARRGDRLVFTFSGHGSWTPDLDGDEPDGRDEVLCAADYASGGLVTDDALHGVLSTTAARRAVVSDSCHSGSVNRFANMPLMHLGATPAEAARRPRFLSPAEFLEGRQLARAQAVEDRPARGVSRRSAVLLSGCADTEFSYDAWLDGRYRGAFTATALRTLTDPAGRDRRLGAWHKHTRAVLPSGDYPQTPQLAASAWERTWRL